MSLLNLVSLATPTVVVTALVSFGAEARAGPVSLRVESAAGAIRVPLAQVIGKGGREQVIHPIAPVAAGSEAERVVRSESDPVAGEGPPILCYVYDEFWMILPVWTTNGRYAVAREFRPPTRPRFLRVFADQSVRAVAAATGLTEARVTRPWTYSVPSGWVALAVIAALLVLLRGRPPSRRYRRLWSDPHYRSAIARLIGKPGHTLPDEPSTGAFVVPTSWEISEETLKPEVEALSNLGIGPGKAESDLAFLIQYLARTGVLVHGSADRVRAPIDHGPDAP
jgi:hypothetical protein